MVRVFIYFPKQFTAVTKSKDDLLQPFLFANFPCPMLRWGTSICRLTFPGSRTTEQHSSAPRIPPSQENAQWPVKPQIKGLCAYSFGKAPDFHRIPLPARGKGTLRNTCTSFNTMFFSLLNNMIILKKISNVNISIYFSYWFPNTNFIKNQKKISVGKANAPYLTMDTERLLLF